MKKLEIVSQLGSGKSVREIAELTGKAEIAIKKIKQEAIEAGVLVPVRSHHERRAFRREVAEWVKTSNATIQNAAEHFKVSTTYVVQCCKENGVRPAMSVNSQIARKASLMSIVAHRLLGSEPSEIAQHFGITRQYVSLAMQRARKSGLLEAIDVLVSRAKAGTEPSDPRKRALENLRMRFSNSREMIDGSAESPKESKAT